LDIAIKVRAEQQVWRRPQSPTIGPTSHAHDSIGPSTHQQINLGILLWHHSLPIPKRRKELAAACFAGYERKLQDTSRSGSVVLYSGAQVSKAQDLLVI